MSNRSIGTALQLPPDQVGPALLAEPEDQWYERKGPRVRPQALANALVGMANAEGGIIVVGLSDTEVEGTARQQANVNSLHGVAMDLTEPPVRARPSVVRCIRADGVEDRLLVFEVEPSTLVHFTNKDEAYLRVGDSTRKLSFQQRQELIYDKGESSFDATPAPDVRPEDLDYPLVKNYARVVGSTDHMKLMRVRGLVSKDGVCSAGGALLFTKEPQEGYPSAYVRILRYRGNERGTGRDQHLDADEDVRISGPIPRMLNEAKEKVRELQPARRVLGSSGTFERQGIIPEDAWLEGLVNAVVHRSYSMGGDHIRVEIFNDRIEITSPGRFPGIFKLEDPLKLDRFARNPRIARVCADLKFSEELGEGIKRMFIEMRSAGLLDPLYTQTDRTVRLLLTATAVGAGDPLPSGSTAILAAIRDAQGMSTGDITEAVGMSRPTVLKRLQQLQTLGLIDRVGKSPQDPRAYWRLHTD